jgi:nucleoside-diphosphate-sugar epimerase
MRLVVWGTGELGGRVGAAWAHCGAPVLGLTKTSHRHAALRQQGIDPALGGAATVLTPGDALLLALPGSAKQQEAVAALAHMPPPVRAVLISSTGYYGTSHGRVDEHTPAGTDSHARAVRAAEAAFRAWAGTGGVVLRLGGLYCRGRGPFTALCRRGAAPLGPPDKTLPLIHYEDAATAILAALQHSSPASTYIGVVPPCPTRQEFYQQACRMVQLPEPTFDAPLGRPPIVYDVTRLQHDLLPVPAHPDWHDALA